jgi:hypothetical protein
LEINNDKMQRLLLPVKFLPCLYIEREKQPSPSTNPVR